MAIAKKVSFNKVEEFERLKMGRLTGEDAAEAYIARMLVNLSSGKTRTNLYRAGPKPWGGLSRGTQTTHFSALCKYISKIEDENEDERVAWLESKNLPGLDRRKLNESDASQAAFWMGATASLNRDTSKRAALHYIISFSPEDTRRLHEPVLKDAADKSLKSIGANEHQALIACHIDRNHRHLHIVLNRIHPVTGKPLNSFQDLIKLERAMRQLEKQYSLKPVQGRHFDLAGHPLPPQAPRPCRRPSRTTALGLMRKQLGNENPFLKARNWDELHQLSKERGVELTHTGSRLALGVRAMNIQVPADDLFKNDGNLNKLEKIFGESYSSWDTNIKETQHALNLGLTLAAFRALDEERRTKEKNAARKRMMKKKHKKETALRLIAERPIRIALSPDLFPESSVLYGPATSERQVIEVVKVLQTEDVKDWLKRTEQFIEQLVKSIEVNPKPFEVSILDDKDALSQMKTGLKVVQAYAVKIGILPKASKKQQSEIELHSISKRSEKHEMG